MPNKTLAIVVNIFFPGVGTLMVKKTTVGIIQILISIVCILGMLITLGLGGIILIPLGFANWAWAIVSSAT